MDVCCKCKQEYKTVIPCECYKEHNGSDHEGAEAECHVNVMSSSSSILSHVDCECFDKVKEGGVFDSECLCRQERART